jgi:hypothetical protein
MDRDTKKTCLGHFSFWAHGFRAENTRNFQVLASISIIYIYIPDRKRIWKAYGFVALSSSFQTQPTASLYVALFLRNERLKIVVHFRHPLGVRLLLRRADGVIDAIEVKQMWKCEFLGSSNRTIQSDFGFSVGPKIDPYSAIPFIKLAQFESGGG